MRKKDWRLLQAYKATGLSPDQVEHYKALLSPAVIELAEQLLEVVQSDRLERAYEILQADADDRCFTFPCHREDTLWSFYNYPNSAVYPVRVTDVSHLNGRTMLNTDKLGVIDTHDVGRVVFLTKEEAERALEEKEAHNADA